MPTAALLHPSPNDSCSKHTRASDISPFRRMRRVVCALLQTRHVNRPSRNEARTARELGGGSRQLGCGPLVAVAHLHTALLADLRVVTRMAHRVLSCGRR